MDVYQTHGAFSWNELTTPDPQSACAFYGELFGWTVKEMGPEMGGYRVVSVGGQGIGGIMAPPPGLPAGAPPHWGAYVTVDDCDAAVERCGALGGRCLVPAMDVPTVGRMAVLQDPQGAVFSVMQYSTPAG